MDIEIHDSVPSKIKTVLLEFINNGVIGLSKMKKLRITTNNNNVPKNNSHSFILEIPYAGSYLTWEVIFSNEDITFAPDFDFINDQFLTDPDIDVMEKQLPALNNWDIEDPKCLYNVVMEILQLYRKYQVQRLQVNKYHRQYMDYSILTGEMNIAEDNIEVLIDQNDCIHFLIIIPIDISILPPYMGKYFENNVSNGEPAEVFSPGANSITLRVSYMTLKAQTCIWLSPHLEEVIGITKQLRIPSFNKDMGLLQYIPAVKKLIHEKLQLISTNYKLRNQFVSTMLAYQGPSIIEYDNVTFSKMTLLLEAQESHCLVLIQLGKHFDMPTLQLRSVYCERNSKPLIEHLTYPYSPEASIEETVKRILNAVYCFLTSYKSDNNREKSDTKGAGFNYANAVNKHSL